MMKRTAMIRVAALAFVTATATCVYCQTAKRSFAISISARKTTLQIGLPIWIGVKIENMSDGILLFQGGRAFGTDSGIIVRDSNGSVVQSILEKLEPKPVPFNGGQSGYGVLPGKSHTEFIDVRTHYDLSTPGQYSIYVQHMDHETNKLVMSNTLEITITP